MEKNIFLHFFFYVLLARYRLRFAHKLKRLGDHSPKIIMLQEMHAFSTNPINMPIF